MHTKKFVRNKKKRRNQPAEASQRGSGHRINQRPKVSKILSNRIFLKYSEKGRTGAEEYGKIKPAVRHSAGDGERKLYFFCLFFFNIFL